jgi:4'-phosphopantetheinyl transferase
MVDGQPLNETERSVAFVWCVPLACTASIERDLSALLAPVEAARAARFATRDERRNYVISHGALRLILSEFTGRHSHAIHIATTARGMPYVVGTGPHFSLSHGGGLALVAVTSEGPIGVDVERVRPDLRLDTFARPLVPRPDVVRIDALAPEERSRAWFQAWTRLEAVAKASGKGLSDDSVADPGDSAPFRVWNLDVDETRVGAVATVPSVAHVVYRAFPNVSSALARFGSA